MVNKKHILVGGLLLFGMFLLVLPLTSAGLTDFFKTITGKATSDDVDNTLHVRIQVTDSSGFPDVGTFDFEFVISDQSDCSPSLYNYSFTDTTNAQGIISKYLPDVDLDFDDQYYLCYYRDGTEIGSYPLSRVPYVFGATSSGLGTNLLAFNEEDESAGFRTSQFFRPNSFIVNGSGFFDPQLTILGVGNPANEGGQLNLVDWNNSIGSNTQTNAWSVDNYAGNLRFFYNSGAIALSIDGNTTNVGVGTYTPEHQLSVEGDASITGKVIVGTLDSASATHVCINGNNLSSCSSSIRYKEQVNPLNLGLNVVKQLHPVFFNWKASGETDLGFIAEEVENVDPLLVTYKDDQVEGVKYGQLTAVLTKAVQEQQTQIDILKNENQQLQKRIEQLERKQ